MHTQMIRGWVVGVLAVLSLLLGVSPAGAHAELESSDPQDGATLTSAPEAITFVFGEEILPQGNAVTLTDVAADVRLEVGPVDVDGDTVSVTWPESSPAGQFRAAFRVVSADGHPINGTITFTVEQAVGAVQASPAAVVASPSAGAASPVPVSQSPSAPAASPSAPAATPVPAADDADAGLLTWVLGIGLAVLIGAVAGTWVMRRTR
jgi:methionine-rich copper-binding protein CopC